MKQFRCQCGHKVYFDNQTCNNCSRLLAFDPVTLTMKSQNHDEKVIAFCVNRFSDCQCNWAVEASASGSYCLSCQMTQILPNLAKPENRIRWQKLEDAKRRLVLDLLRLGLPVDSSKMQFRFLEDQRTNPDVVDEHVTTGHADGLITINVAEADSVFREQMREQMNEPYRTVLGHFRHESGHYYFNQIVQGQQLEAARQLFGDERFNYQQALQDHYDNGPPANWEHRYLSTYASSHPSEDWAECWAHYLHIYAVLEVAENSGLISEVESTDWQHQFVELASLINEIMRNLGLPNAYPFVLSGLVKEKIEFVHDTIALYRQGAAADDVA